MGQVQEEWACPVGLDEAQGLFGGVTFREQPLIRLLFDHSLILKERQLRETEGLLVSVVPHVVRVQVPK